MLTKLKNYFSKEDKNYSVKESDLNNDLRSENNNIEKEIIDNRGVGKADRAETDKSVPALETGSKHSIEEIKEEVIKVLKTCYDPEIPVDVWELGLIYEIKVATNGDVLIIMTLTSPSCPVAGILPGEIEQKIKEHPMVNDCKVELTFDPPWSQKNMSEVAKLELGFL